MNTLTLEVMMADAFTRIIREFAEDEQGDRLPLSVVHGALDRAKIDAEDTIEKAHGDWLSGQEGPTYDDALGARCAALAREDEARKLKGMAP